MLKHKILAHGDQNEKITFKMKILKKHNTAFSRQVHEAVVVEMNENNNILNSKGGFNRCKLPRLVIKMGDIESKDGDHQEKEMSEFEIEQEIEKMRRERNLRRRDCLEKAGEPPNKRVRRRKINRVARINDKSKSPDLHGDGAECDNKKRKLELETEAEEN